MTFLLHQPLTCTGEAVLEDDCTAEITPGVLDSGLEGVTLASFLLHPRVPLPGREDGSHIGGSEALLPAARRRLETVRLAARPLGVRDVLLRLVPHRLQSLQSGRLRRRVSAGGSHHHSAFGVAHFRTWRRPRSFRRLARRPRRLVDGNTLHRGKRVVRDRGARGGVFPTSVHGANYYARCRLATAPRPAPRQLNANRWDVVSDGSDWFARLRRPRLPSATGWGGPGARGNGLDLILPGSRLQDTLQRRTGTFKAAFTQQTGLLHTYHP